MTLLIDFSGCFNIPLDSYIERFVPIETILQKPETNQTNSETIEHPAFTSLFDTKIVFW